MNSIVRKISLVTGLIFNIRIHVFIILARMEVVIILYTKLHGTTSSLNSVLDMLIYKRVLEYWFKAVFNVYFRLAKTCVSNKHDSHMSISIEAESSC